MGVQHNIDTLEEVSHNRSEESVQWIAYRSDLCGGDVRTLSTKVRLLISCVLIVVTVYAGVGSYLFMNASPWTQELVGHDIADHAEMAMDSTGGLHLAYLGRYYMTYAYKPSGDAYGKWSSVRVVTLNGGVTGLSLAVDSQNKTYICTDSAILDQYSAGTGNWTITYATDRTGEWRVENITVKDIAKDSKVVACPDGSIHILYVLVAPWDQLSTNSSLVDLANHGLGWESTVAIRYPWGGGAHLLALTSDSDGALCALIMTSSPAGTYLNFTTNRGGEWRQSTVASGGDLWGGRASMVLDNKGIAHICYCKYGSGADYSLVYSNNTAGGWTSSAVGWTGNPSGGMGIALDSFGRAHIVYFGEHGGYSGPVKNYTLRVATLTDGRSKVETVANRMGSYPNHVGYAGSAEPRAEYASIAIDASGRVHLAYYYADYGYIGDMHAYFYVGYATNLPIDHVVPSFTRAGLYTLPVAGVAGVSAVLYLRGYRIRPPGPRAEGRDAVDKEVVVDGYPKYMRRA